MTNILFCYVFYIQFDYVIVAHLCYNFDFVVSGVFAGIQMYSPPLPVAWLDDDDLAGM